MHFFGAAEGYPKRSHCELSAKSGDKVVDVLIRVRQDGARRPWANLEQPIRVCHGCVIVAMATPWYRWLHRISEAR